MTAPPRVLHVLSQRPMLTGSGVTLDALVRRAARAGWEQEVVCAIPADGAEPEVGGLPRARIHPLRFGGAELPLAIPGMSDVMPYPSRRFSSLDADELALYERAWVAHCRPVIERFAPDVVHAHHVWLLTSLLGRELLADRTPMIAHCHGTGLRQRILCPELGARAAAGSARARAVLALHDDHRTQLVDELGFDAERVHVVGAGYPADVFHPGDDPAMRSPTRIVYAGKLADAKGVPQLLDAIAEVARRRPVELCIAGGGDGPEADALRARATRMAPTVALCGRLDQPALAALLRSAAVFVLPSLFEGLPLVLIEAAACGCRLVSTDLPGVRRSLAPSLGDALERVPLPRLVGADRPVAADVPAFVGALTGALDRALDRGPLDPTALPSRLSPFTWDAVYTRVEHLWHTCLQEPHSPN